MDPRKHEDRSSTGCDGLLSNTHVTETLEEIPVTSVGEKNTGKLVAKARPRQTSNLTLSAVSIPSRERKWIDIEPGRFNKSCLKVSNLMIRLLRHDDSIYREEDGAIRFEDLASTIDQGMGPPRAGQFGHTEKILYLRAIQGHSRSAFVDPSLQDNVLLPDDFIEHIYHVVNSHDLHSIIQSGLIPGSKSQEREASGVLHSRQSNVRRSGQRSRVRPEQSEDCSVQEYLENSPKDSIRHDPTQSSLQHFA